MMGTADNRHPDVFWTAEFMEATARLVHVIRRYQPEVVIAYDPFGGYGHPDHIQVNRVGTAAFFGADDVGRFPPAEGEGLWTPCKLYWVTFPRSRTLSIRRALFEAGEITEEEFHRRPAPGVPGLSLVGQFYPARPPAPWGWGLGSLAAGAALVALGHRNG